MITVKAMSTVLTPGHRAAERHPATVWVNADDRHPHVYAHYVPAPADQPEHPRYHQAMR